MGVHLGRVFRVHEQRVREEGFRGQIGKLYSTGRKATGLSARALVMRLISIPEITKCDHCGLIQEDIMCGKARLEISQQSLGNNVHDGSSVSKNANTIPGEFRTPLGPTGVQTRRTLQWSRDNGVGSRKAAT